LYNIFTVPMGASYLEHVTQSHSHMQSQAESIFTPRETDILL